MDDLTKYAVSIYSSYICRNFTDGLCLTMLSNSLTNTDFKVAKYCCVLKYQIRLFFVYKIQCVPSLHASRCAAL